MFWSLTCDDDAPDDAAFQPQGRFVLHRHRDADGPHLDLRLEQDDALVGWRIAAESLETGAWATEKRPHPVHWLEHDGDALCDDRGVYACIESGGDVCSLLLRGQHGLRRLRLAREGALPARAARDVCRTLVDLGARADDAPRLLRDGFAARQRAVERLCGLGRELDGAAFDEPLWRRTLEGLSLDEIHAQLRAYEVRFDLKYPPAPVSRPEPLPEEDDGRRTRNVLTLLRDDG